MNSPNGRMCMDALSWSEPWRQHLSPESPTPKPKPRNVLPPRGNEELGAVDEAILDAFMALDKGGDDGDDGG